MAAVVVSHSLQEQFKFLTACLNAAEAWVEAAGNAAKDARPALQSKADALEATLKVLEAEKAKEVAAYAARRDAATKARTIQRRPSTTLADLSVTSTPGSRPASASNADEMDLEDEVYEEPEYWMRIAELDAMIEKTAKKLAEMKLEIHVSIARGNNYRYGYNGVYVGVQDFWLEEISGQLTVQSYTALEAPPPPPPAGAPPPPPRPRVSNGIVNLVLKGQAGGTSGFLLNARVYHLSVRGEKGTRVPSLNVESLTLRMEAVVKAQLVYLRRTNKWVVAEPLVFEVITLDKDQVGSIKVPSQILRMVVEYLVPTWLKDFLLSSVPQELGPLLLASNFTASAVTRVCVRSLSMACLDTPFVREATATVTVPVAPASAAPPVAPRRTSGTVPQLSAMPAVYGRSMTSGLTARAGEDEDNDSKSDSEGSEANDAFGLPEPNVRKFEHLPPAASYSETWAHILTNAGRQAAIVHDMSVQRRPAVHLKAVGDALGLSEAQVWAIYAAQRDGAGTKKSTPPISCLSELLQMVIRYRGTGKAWATLCMAWQQLLNTYTALSATPDIDFEKLVQRLLQLNKKPFSLLLEVSRFQVDMNVDAAITMLYQMYTRQLREAQQKLGGSSERRESPAAAARRRPSTMGSTSSHGTPVPPIATSNGSVSGSAAAGSTNGGGQSQQRSTSPTSQFSGASGGGSVSGSRPGSVSHRPNISFDDSMSIMSTPSTRDAHGSARAAARASLATQVLELEQWYSDVSATLRKYKRMLTTAGLNLEFGLVGGEKGSLAMRARDMSVDVTPGYTFPYPLGFAVYPAVSYSLRTQVNSDGTFSCDMLLPKGATPGLPNVDTDPHDSLANLALSHCKLSWMVTAGSTLQPGEEALAFVLQPGDTDQGATAFEFAATSPPSIFLRWKAQDLSIAGDIAAVQSQFRATQAASGPPPSTTPTGPPPSTTVSAAAGTPSAPTTAPKPDVSGQVATFRILSNTISKYVESEALVMSCRVKVNAAVLPTSKQKAGSSPTGLNADPTHVRLLLSTGTLRADDSEPSPGLHSAAAAAVNAAASAAAAASVSRPAATPTAGGGPIVSPPPQQLPPLSAEGRSSTSFSLRSGDEGFLFAMHFRFFELLADVQRILKLVQDTDSPSP